MLKIYKILTMEISNLSYIVYDHVKKIILFPEILWKDVPPILGIFHLFSEKKNFGG